MYLRLMYQVDHVQNMFPDGNTFPHLSRQVGLGGLMTALVRLTTKHRIKRLSYLICGLHILMLGPKDVVHASQHVTTSLIVRRLPEIIFLSYTTRSSGLGLWRTFLRENELLVLTDQHDIDV